MISEYLNDHNNPRSIIDFQSSALQHVRNDQYCADRLLFELVIHWQPGKWERRFWWCLWL